MSNLTISKRSLSTLKADFTAAVIDAIEEGEISPIEAWVYMHQVKNAIEALTSDSLLRDRVKDLAAEKVQEIEDFELKTTTGGPILDYEADHVYVEKKYELEERKKLLDVAFKSKSTIYDSEGVEIPKVPIKTYRKDSVMVTRKRK